MEKVVLFVWSIVPRKVEQNRTVHFKKDTINFKFIWFGKEIKVDL
ncbi:hypothetical protein [Oceanobacillus kimchii]|uniref:Uncharacterized protein n=1 Tax=Oceanobacillus kimchii TaxID=746691 RepID=A0ABQ5TH68_9BACI|nr:hypothetical protein [Oceanobacillus kimchii]GLO66219.1 hypothetical protein MACH08_20030 [Oceanobacillus kimchii]